MQSNEPDVEQIIRSSLADRSAQTILGAELGALLSSEGVSYKADCGSLTNFLKTHVPTLIEVGRAGQDKVFSFVANSAVGMPIPRASLSLWKEFASPNSSSTIVLDATTKAVLLLAPDEYITEGMILLNRVSREELAEIAKNYSDDQEVGAFGVNDREIRTAIANSESNWYSLLRRSSPALIPNWNTYRISAIEQVFERRIRQALQNTAEPVDANDIVANALSELRSSRVHTIRANSVVTMRETEGGQFSKAAANKSGRNDQSSMMDMRELALAAISQMNETDLSRLWVPLSSVVQVMRKAGSR